MRQAHGGGSGNATFSGDFLARQRIVKGEGNASLPVISRDSAFCKPRLRGTDIRINADARG